MPVLDQDEVRLLQLLGEGYTIPAVARKLGISASSADKMAARVRHKLGTRSVAAAFVIAVRRGEIRRPPRLPNPANLSAFELTALFDIVYDFTNEEMRLCRNVSLSTIKHRVSHVLEELHARNRVHAVYRGFQYGLIH